MSKKCRHPDFRANVAVNRMEDTGRFAADIRVECAVCREPFRFLGVESGLSPLHPMVSVDGLELRAPIEPEGEKRLAPVSYFSLPPELIGD